MLSIRFKGSRAALLGLTLALVGSVLGACGDGGGSSGPVGSDDGGEGGDCEGERGCACYGNGTCDAGLECRSGKCEREDDSGGAGGTSSSAGSGGANAGRGNAGGSGGSGNGGSGGSNTGGTSGSHAGGDDPGAGGSGEPVDFVDPLAGDLTAKTVALYAATTSVGHGCISTEEGEVYCWGLNGSGQLGDGTDAGSSKPVKVLGISTAQKVVTGDAYSCALLADATVRCWGDNENFHLSTGDQVDAWEPVVAQGLSGIVDLAARSEHNCAVRDDGAVLCWGWSGEHLGYTGIGSTPKVVSGLSGKATAVAVGDAFSCALIEDGTVQCWGANNVGQLGNDSVSHASSRTPVKVKGIDAAVALSSGSSHLCALIDDGSVWCWGSGNEHQLGKNSGTHSYAPTKVLGIDDATSIGAGLHHTCATRAAGTVSCWGRNDYGEAGTGTTKTVIRAWDTAPGIDDAVQVFAGTFSTCAVLEGGKIQCWGDNQGARIALGSLPYAVEHRTPEGFKQGGRWYAPHAPGALPGAGDIVQIVASTGRSCVVRTNGDVDCWGDNYDHRIGDGSVDPVPAPTKVGALSGVTQLSDFGSGQMCARKNDSSVLCLGGASVPVRLDNAIAVTNGYDFGCAIVDSLAVQCWGEGFAHTQTSSRGAVDVTAGSNHLCAVMSDGIVHCWGYFDEASLGSNQPGLSGLPYDPSTVTGVTGARQASAGLSHTCALLGNGHVVCWGANLEGQLGDGSGQYSRLAVDVGLQGVTQISSGWYHSCAVTAAGKVYCWGDNAFGQIGNDDIADALAPEAVVGIDDAVQVDGGQHHTCALHRDGTMSCWGRNENGELGDGTQDDSPVPVRVSGL